MNHPNNINQPNLINYQYPMNHVQHINHPDNRNKMNNPNIPNYPNVNVSAPETKQDTKIIPNKEKKKIINNEGTVLQPLKNNVEHNKAENLLTSKKHNTNVNNKKKSKN
ncbi:hypothetical protein PFHG_05622, partial [Plasmodium falciparum HB3]